MLGKTNGRSVNGVFITIALLSSACGHSTVADVATTTDAAEAAEAADAAEMVSPQPCWLDTYTPGGTVELGTMPDTVHIAIWGQGGYVIETHARITAMIPGNADDVLDPTDPRTRFNAYWVETGQPIFVPVRCATRLGYAPSSVAGSYDMAMGTAVPFDFGLSDADIVGKQVRVVVEVIDANGLYATAEKVVTCGPSL